MSQFRIEEKEALATISVVLTEHAIQRIKERIVPTREMHAPEITQYLNRYLSDGMMIKKRDYNSQYVIHFAETNLVFIVKNDGSDKPGRYAAVTVEWEFHKYDDGRDVRISYEL